jgi:hypothetical protein
MNIKNIVTWTLRIICLLVPLLGFILAILMWAFRQEKMADDLLFFSFVGIFVCFVLVIFFFLGRVFFF